MADYATQLLFMLLALAIVLALAWLVLRAIRAIHPGKFRDDRLKLLLSLPVGTRERLIVIRYRKQDYLLGVTGASIDLLDKQPATDDQNQEEVGSNPS
ncbi:flagellar biosynthetic protein FliO [Thiolapillus sp.]